MIDGLSSARRRTTVRREGQDLDGRLADLFGHEHRSEMQQRVLDHDWSGGPLGPESEWSATLRTAVGICLNSRFGMVLMWGPERVMVYNDGYAPMVGLRHPEALGRPAAEVLSDIWPYISGMVDTVFAGGVVYEEDLPLTMTRRGFEEEVYFTFSYSPVMEPDGRVVALLTTITETTPRVLATRRLSVLQQLGSRPRSLYGTAAEACASALEVLAASAADCPWSRVYLVEPATADGRTGNPTLVAGHGVDPAGAPLLAEVRAAAATGRPELAAGSPPGAAPAVVEPLVLAGQRDPVGAIVLGTSPRLLLDDGYRRFLTLVAAQVAAAVTDAQAVERERRQASEQAELEQARARFFSDVAVTLQRSILGPTVLPDGFAVHYAPASGTLEVGGDWYDVIDLPDGLLGVVVGDVVGRGLAAAAVMGQLRSAARALLLESRSPVQVLTALDGFAGLVPGAVCSTVFCAVVDPVRRVLRYSNAGHLPALVAHADGRTELLEGARSLPLAVLAGVVRPEAEATLPPASTLLLYTDGLVERRGELLDDGIARAAAALREGSTLDTLVLAALLTSRLLDAAHDDDVAFLLYRAAG